MTSRAKPVKTKPRRSSWESERRQQVIVTILFAAVITLGVVILLGAVGVSYYNDHLLAVATVGGQGISRDRWIDRVNVLSFRLDEGEARLREAVAAGQLDSATEQQEISQLESGRASIEDQALQGLIDNTFLAQAAAPLGITVSDADIQAQIQSDASLPEQRRAQVITFQPIADPGTGLPTAVMQAAAQTSAQKALTDLQAGRSLADVATADGADATGVQDFGYITSRDTSDDPNLVAAIFALTKPGFTPVVAGQDGFLRIAQVTDIRAAVPDGNFMTTLKTYTTLDAYRDAVRGQLMQQKVTARITADDLASDVTQVQAYEIQLGITTNQSTGTSDANSPKIRVSHILYSPNGDATAAQTLDPNDPAWAKSKAQAQATADKLRAITSIPAREAEFAAIAKTDSDDTGSAPSGGDLGLQTTDTFVAAFASAINGSHTRGEIIGPILSQYGYHVIMWEARQDAPSQFINELAALLAKHQPGYGFQALAVADSSAADAPQGGYMGWFAKGQATDYHIEQALFGLQPGGVSSPLQLSDGYYLYMVAASQTRRPFGDQVSTIRANAFNDWYGPLKDAANTNQTITTDPSMSSIILQGQTSQ